MVRSNRTGQDRTGQDRTGQDRTGLFSALLRLIENNWKIIFGFLIIIQAIGLFVSLITSKSYIEPDTMSYIVPAENFLKTGTMLDGLGVPIWTRTPGYPLLLAVIYWLAGGIVNFDKNICVLILQCLMCVLNSLMIFYCVNTITSKKAYGVFAVLFYICDIAVYDNAVRVLTDVPFSFFITLSVFLFTKYYFSNKKIYIILSIFTINYALMVRPALLYFNMILALIIFFAVILRKINWKLGVLYLIVYLAMFGGWCARNAYYHDVTFETMYTPIRVKDSFEYYAPLTYQIVEGILNTPDGEAKSAEVFKEWLYEKYPDFDNMPFNKRVYAEADIGRGYIKQHILAYIRLNFYGLFTEMIGPGMTFIKSFALPDILKRLIALSAAGMLALLYLIYAIGFLLNIKNLKLIHWAIFLLTAYLMASTAVLGYSRFRMAFYAICTIGAFSSFASSNRLNLNKNLNSKL